MFNELLQALGVVGNVLDTPGSVVRGLVSGKPGRALSGILDPEQRVHGSEITGDPYSGFAVDLATDPLNLIGGLGMLKTASKAKKALAANDAAMQTLASAYREAKEVPKWYRDSLRPSYVAAIEEAAKMPRHNPMLKLPLSEAAKKAKSMTWGDFVLGPAKATGADIPKASFFGKEGGKYVASEMPAELQNTWNLFASRYPKTAGKYSNLAQETNSAGSFIRPEKLAEVGLPELPQGMVSINKGAFSDPGTMIHEMLHAGQHRIGKLKRLSKGVSQEAWDLAVEAPAFRRSQDFVMADALHDYGNALKRVPSQSPLIAALLGHNAGRSGAYL